VCFQQLVRPLLAALSGSRALHLPSVSARLDTELRSRSGRRYFVLSRVRWEAEGFVASPLANQCSALVRTSAGANAIITIREGPADSIVRLRPGDSVEVELFDVLGLFCSTADAYCTAEAVS
jgi:molybdopterin biosynthesis enzyme